MKKPSHHYYVESPADYLEILYRRHFQGALVRSGASVIMWLFALAAFLTRIVNVNQFVGITLSVLYLILINPPILLLLKRITHRRTYRYASLLINFLEVLGYTAIIYFRGGIEAPHLTLIYAALITYVGVMAPRSFPYIIAIMCSTAFSFVVAGEHFGFLPRYSAMYHFDLPWISKWDILSVVIGLLFVVAYISSLTSATLKKNRNKLREKNLELIEKTRTLEEAENELRIAHQELETRVEKRTVELAKVNEDLESELTARKQAEEALRKSEEKYRAIIEKMEEGYLEVDLTGRLTFFNEAAQKFLGYSVEETMGMHYKQYADEENARKIYTAYNEVYRTGVPLGHFEWEATRKDGTRRTVEGSAYLIRNIEGQPTGFRGIFRDITDGKHLQEERQRLQERLQRAEKMEALGTLAGGVAHDLNNVLGIVVGYSELLLDEIDESSKIRSYIINMKSSGERAVTIVQDLLTLARRGVQTRVIFNLNTIINDFQKSPEFEKMCSFHPNVQIKTDLKADLLNITGSPIHLSKTFFNLVSNAAEAMTDGGILTIKTANEYLDKPIQGYDEVREGDYVVLSVSDTGDGIQAADLKRIFEPFYTKKVMGRSGTGLGLAVVWGTVKDHNGYINVQSEEGKGSTFTLYFPVTREDISAERIAVDISEYVGKGESILIVDDVEGQRELASQMLKKLNYIVATVSSGEEALEYLKTKKQTSLF